MTLDEAKEILEEIKLNDDCLTQYIAGFDEALDMAIKALEQEPKPMVEIDLYSVIKQKYIEREVLDKIKEIVDKWRSDTWTDNLSHECMAKIAELVDSQKSEGEK